MALQHGNPGSIRGFKKSFCSVAKKALVNTRANRT